MTTQSECIGVAITNHKESSELNLLEEPVQKKKKKARLSKEALEPDWVPPVLSGGRSENSSKLM